MSAFSYPRHCRTVWNARQLLIGLRSDRSQQRSCVTCAQPWSRHRANVMKDQWTPKQMSQPRCCLPVCGLAHLACLAVLSCCGGLDRWMLLVLVLLLVGRPRRLLRHPQSSHSTVVPCILGRAVVPPKRPYDCYASTIWLSSLPPNTQGFNEGSRMEREAWHRPACACVRNTAHNTQPKDAWTVS